MPERNADDVIVVPFNDPDALRAAFAAHGHKVAALLMEPVNYDQGCIAPLPGFAALCRKLCDAPWRAAVLRRGADRLPMAPACANRAIWASRPTCACWARPSAAACPSARWWAGAVMRHLADRAAAR